MKKKSYLPLVLVGLFLLALCVFAATPELWVYGSGQMQDSTPYPVETQIVASPYPTPAVTTRPFQQNYELVIGGIILLAIILFGVIKFPVHKKH